MAPLAGGGCTLEAAGEVELARLVQAVAEFVPRAGAAVVVWTRIVERPAQTQAKPLESPGLVTVENRGVGGYRDAAELAVDAAARQLRSPARSITAHSVLPAAPGAGEPEDLQAAVERAVRHEQCQTLADFLRRRSTLALREDQGLGVAPEAARRLAAELAWSAGRMEAELIHYRQWVLRTREPMRRRMAAR